MRHSIIAEDSLTGEYIAYRDPNGSDLGHTIWYSVLNLINVSHYTVHVMKQLRWLGGTIIVYQLALTIVQSRDLDTTLK